MSASKLFLYINNFKIEKMSEPNKNLQLLNKEQQSSLNRQNITDNDVLEDEEFHDGEAGDIAIQGGEVEIAGVASMSDALLETHNMLMAWEKMIAGESNEDMMEGVESALDADLDDVDLSDLLELEMAQPDDIALFGSQADFEWASSHQWGGQLGLGISMNSQLPLPFPAPATPPSPPPDQQIPGLDLYSRSAQSDPSQLHHTFDNTISDLPPSTESNMSSSDFFEQYEEVEQDEIEFPGSDFVKTEVNITNAEWWLNEIHPYQKYRARHPSRLRTCWTVIDGREGVGVGLPADDSEDW